MARPKKTATAKKIRRVSKPKKAAMAKTGRKKAVSKPTKPAVSLHSLLRNLLQDVEKQITSNSKDAGKESAKLKKKLAKAITKQKQAKKKKAVAAAKATSKRTAAAKAQLARAQADYINCRDEAAALQAEFNQHKSSLKSAKSADKQLAALEKLIAKFEKSQSTTEKVAKKIKRGKVAKVASEDGAPKKKRGRPAGSKNKATVITLEAPKRRGRKKKASFADNIAETLIRPIEESTVVRDDVDSMVDADSESREPSFEY